LNIPRLNGIIKVLEQGKHAFVSFSPADTVSAQSYASEPYDGIVFEMEHGAFDTRTLRDCLQYMFNRRQIVESASLAPAVTPLVRIPPNGIEMNQWIAKQVLDAGVELIVVGGTAAVMMGAPVVTFDTDDEALALANDSEYGLTGAVYSRSISRGLALAQRFRSGMVHVNDQTVNDEATIPFGGMGASGNGARFGGAANWDEFTEWQWVTVREDPRSYPYPY